MMKFGGVETEGRGGKQVAVCLMRDMVGKSVCVHRCHIALVFDGQPFQTCFSDIGSLFWLEISTFT